MIRASQKPKDGEEPRDPAGGLSKKDFCQMYIILQCLSVHVLETKNPTLFNFTFVFQQSGEQEYGDGHEAHGVPAEVSTIREAKLNYYDHDHAQDFYITEYYV